MGRKPSLRGFGAGVLVGLLLGSVGMAGATFVYTGWTRFSQDFRVGYVTGFLDVLELSRNTNPGGFIDEKYPRIPKVRPMEWTRVIGELYQKPENQKYNISSIFMLAGHELKKKYGSESSDDRLLARAKKQFEEARKRAEAAAKAEGKSVRPAVEAPNPGPSTALVVPPTKKELEPKWCRCDGVTPKNRCAKTGEEEED